MVAAVVCEYNQYSELTVIHLRKNLCEMFEVATQSRHDNKDACLNPRPGDLMCTECSACACMASLQDLHQLPPTVMHIRLSGNSKMPGGENVSSNCCLLLCCSVINCQVGQGGKQPLEIHTYVT